MNRIDFEELLAPARFSPFVLTTHDGFSIAIGPEQREHILVAARMLVIMDSAGDLVHIPYASIAHIHEPN
jgi:hypothetical protein